MSTKRHIALFGVIVAYALVFLATAAVGSMAFFHFGDPKNTCATCHEMGGVHSDWSASAHRTLHCRNCHGGSLTLDAHALRSHLRRVTQHLAGRVDGPIGLAEKEVLAVHESCRTCHPQNFAEWQASRHTTNYGRIFLDPEHNKKEQPAEDCLRCHGMYFSGGMRELITPLDKTGPWALKDEGKAAHPAIPCLACHQIHTPAENAQPPHFFDRREHAFFTAARLPSPKIHAADGRPIRVAFDPRQRLCQQCHAPGAAHLSGTSDDRTPTGVHEGLSCLDCHQMHTTSARASCATCHPANSHCGLDVEKMDTTFVSPESQHNIHRVACRDCHPQGTPAKAPTLPTPQP